MAHWGSAPWEMWLSAHPPRSEPLRVAHEPVVLELLSMGVLEDAYSLGRMPRPQGCPSNSSNSPSTDHAPLVIPDHH